MGGGGGGGGTGTHGPSYALVGSAKLLKASGKIILVRFQLMEIFTYVVALRDLVRFS